MLHGDDGELGVHRVSKLKLKFTQPLIGEQFLFKSHSIRILIRVLEKAASWKFVTPCPYNRVALLQKLAIAPGD